jgi:hypothetical protein
VASLCSFLSLASAHPSDAAVHDPLSLADHLIHRPLLSLDADLQRGQPAQFDHAGKS